jgi:ketosteroid isomerase-like protein
MNKFLPAALIICVLSFHVSAQTGTLPDTPNLLKEKLEMWSGAINNKDLKTLALFYSRDYLGFYPGQTTQTFASCIEQFNRLFKNNFIDMKISVKFLECDAEGSLALLRIVEITKVISKYAKQPEIATDTGIMVWKKQSGGEWQIYRSALYPVEDKKGSPDLEK